jgi:deoxyribonuclease-4
LQTGSRIGAHAVVLHPGSAKAGDVRSAIARAGETIRAALGESEGCPLHLENTAGAGGTLGRSIDELAALLDASGGDERLGLCLDSCHLFASGYDIRTAAGTDAVVAEVASKLGLGRLGALHLNDSQMGLGSNRDRHANVGKGQLGRGGCAAFLGASAFEALPCVLETPGKDHEGPSKREVALARSLHERGVAERR